MNPGDTAPTASDDRLALTRDELLNQAFSGSRPALATWLRQLADEVADEFEQKGPSSTDTLRLLERVMETLACLTLILPRDIDAWRIAASAADFRRDHEGKGRSWVKFKMLGECVRWLRMFNDGTMEQEVLD